MNRTLLITTAALAAAFVQPLHAKEGRSGGGGDRGGARMDRGASVQVPQAPRAEARVQQAPRAEMRVPQAPRVTQSPSFTTRTMRAPQVEQRATVTNNNRTFERRDRQSPTIAFGGSTTVNRNANIERERRFETTRTTRDFDRDRSDFRRVPNDVWRNWDRRNIHTWNNHRYRWYNNNWVLFDSGLYGGGSYWYPTQSYVDSYDDFPDPGVTTYSTTDSLAISVQSELARRGYNPGSIDGVVGPQTRNAIAQFQSDNRLPVTGRIDRRLVDELDLD